MNMKKSIIAAVVAGAVVLGLSGCYDTSEYDKRKADQDSITLDNSLEKTNLKEKLERENDPNAIRYVYVMNFGQIVGYYVTKGKISSNGSQLAPEQEVIKRYSDGYVLDSAQDDGTFGAGDPGIFFFTSDGVMVVTSLDYIQTDSPLTIDVPRLGGTN
jgi:hypothetical protein